jgi:hypothetical protein
MPRIEFAAENKLAPKTNYNYPKLRLKKDERARIVLLEAPVREYVHTLRQPQVENGIAKKTIEKDFNDKDVERYALDFISNPICLGRPEILAAGGLDDKNCPACALAKKHPDMTQAPKPRYAMHVIRYRTQGGSFNIQTPYSPETLVWSFTSTVFDKIADFKDQWGNLQKHDLLLGPCTIEKFQKFDINISPTAEWLEGGDERKALTAETFKNNQIEDLAIACGSVKKAEWIEQDVQKIIDKWKEVKGDSSADSSTDLDTDLNDLLGKNETKVGDSGVAQKEWSEPESTPSSSSSDDDDDLLGGLGVSDTPSAPAEEPKKDAPKAAAKDDAMDIDDLLNGL